MSPLLVCHFLDLAMVLWFGSHGENSSSSVFCAQVIPQLRVSKHQNKFINRLVEGITDFLFQVVLRHLSRSHTYMCW